MRRTISIATIRRIAKIGVAVIVILFAASIIYLWIGFSDVIGDGVAVDGERRLLTDFDTSKFDTAIERLEKRRNLEGPAEGLRDPFGVVQR